MSLEWAVASRLESESGRQKVERGRKWPSGLEASDALAARGHAERVCARTQEREQRQKHSYARNRTGKGELTLAGEDDTLSSIAAYAADARERGTVCTLAEGGATTAVLELLLCVYALVPSKGLADRAGLQSIRAEEGVLLPGVVLVRPVWAAVPDAEVRVAADGWLRLGLLRRADGLALVVPPVAARLADCAEGGERKRESIRRLFTSTEVKEEGTHCTSWSRGRRPR